MPRRRKNIHQRSAGRTMSKMSLSPSEESLSAAFANVIGHFVKLSGALGSAESNVIEALLTDFDTAITEVAQISSGVNLMPIIAQETIASKVALAIIAEWRELGRDLSLKTASGDQPNDEGDDLLSEVADMIADVEGLDITERISLFASSPTAAAFAVGAHFARGGDNDPFFHSPWSLHAIGVSIFAAAAVSATLARVAVESGIDAFSTATVSELAMVARNSYMTINERDQTQLEGFGTASRVVEEALVATDWIEGLELTDAHRLSALLVPAFVAGLNARPYNVREQTEAGKMIIAAAVTSGKDTTAVSGSQTVVVGRPPKAGRLLN